MSADDPFSSGLIEFCRCFSLVIDFLVEFHYYLSAGLFPKSPSFIRNLFIPISSSCHQSHILLYPVAHYNSFSLSFLSHKLYLSWPFSEIKLLSFLCSWPSSSLLFLYTFSPTLNYEHSLYTWHFAWTSPSHEPWPIWPHSKLCFYSWSYPWTFSTCELSLFLLFHVDALSIQSCTFITLRSLWLSNPALFHSWLFQTT